MELAGVLSDGFADEMELAAPLDVPFGRKVHNAMSLDDLSEDDEMELEDSWLGGVHPSDMDLMEGGAQPSRPTTKDTGGTLHGFTLSVDALLPWFNLADMTMDEVHTELGARMHYITCSVNRVFRRNAWRCQVLQRLEAAFRLTPVAHSLTEVFQKLCCCTARLRREYKGQLAQVVEFWAGKAGLTTHLQSKGVRAIALDWLLGPGLDINSPDGFRAHLVLACAIEVDGKAWSGFECTSWVFVCSSVTGRKRSCPMGHTHVELVRRGNEHLLRQAALTLLLHLNHVEQVLENPRGTRLIYAPLFASLCAEVHWKRTLTWLGAFGFPSPKPLWLWSTGGFAVELACPQPKHCTERLCVTQCTRDASGRTHVRVTGVRSRLKASAAYPLAFCAAAGDMLVGRL